MDTVDLGSIKTSCDPCSPENGNLMCKPCRDEGNETIANGWCQECQEHMCKTCFRHHAKSKFCKEHVLLNEKPSSTKLIQSLDGLSKCQQHMFETVKFYCAAHGVCGCGDCMILEHKTCDVAYIPKMAVSGDDSEEFKGFAEELESYRAQIKSCIAKIRNNKKESQKAHEHFVTDVEVFREGIVSHVNELATKICEKSSKTKEKRMQKCNELMEEAAAVKTEIETMSKRLETNKNQPNRLFVSMVDMKTSLQEMPGKILKLKKQDGEEEFYFQKDSLLESMLVKCHEIGQLKTSSEMKQEHDEIDAGSDYLQESPVPKSERKICNLQDLKLKSEYLLLDKDTLSYNGSDDMNGIYIAKTKMTPQCYFEVEILKDKKGGSVAIGLVPRNYPRHYYPGWKKGSIGYHSDDGKIFVENVFTHVNAPCGQSDKMGCKMSYKGLLGVVLTFTKNGQRIGEELLRTSNDLFPAVALDTEGQKVKVRFQEED